MAGFKKVVGGKVFLLPATFSLLPTTLHISFMAALIGTQISYLLLAFAPPLVWLAFYLHEDRHPEPKRLILLTFVGGMGAAIFSLIGECIFVGLIGGSCRSGISSDANVFALFLGIALIEEYLKYAAVKALILRRADFDEPVDAMIYLMTSALGFAALENVLFLMPVFQDNVSSGLLITTNRFLGANLLHALSSGIVGFFLARAWFHPQRHHFVALGVVLATLLHAAFNTLILTREALPQGLLYVILLLSVMAAVVFVEFERLKRSYGTKSSQSIYFIKGTEAVSKIPKSSS